MGLVLLKEEARQLANSVPAIWGHSEKSAVYNLEERFYQYLTMLTPWSQTSSLQNCEQ